MQEDWDNMEKWTTLWEKARKEGVFNNAPRPPVTSPQEHAESLCEEFKGGPRKKSEVPKVQEVDAKYWESLHQLAGTQRYHEDADVVAKSKDLANAPNPVHHNTHGKDQDLHVTPNWTDGEKLKKLSELKLKLHKLGDELAAVVGGDGKKSAAVGKKLETLNKQFDDLSNSLQPDYVEEDES